MRIYLDHNATTPLRDEVVDEMLPLLREGYGNPSSTHAEGAAVRKQLELARDRIPRRLVLEMEARIAAFREAIELMTAAQAVDIGNQLYLVFQYCGL